MSYCLVVLQDLYRSDFRKYPAGLTYAYSIMQSSSSFRKLTLYLHDLKYNKNLLIF